MEAIRLRSFSLDYVTVKAYAKVNIGLKVGKKRADGFHDIESFFHLVDLHDDIRIGFEFTDEFRCRINGNESYLDEGVEDLMAKALRLFSEKSCMIFETEITIDKHIPFKAGLGGGSSDAGAVLRAANEYFDFPLSFDELQEIALQVGSDVPFFSSGMHHARVTGRGESLSERPTRHDRIDLYFPSFFVETKGAYRMLDEMDRDMVSLPCGIIGYPSGAVLKNDFELTTPRTDEIEKIAELYPYFSLSGSGSTYFGLLPEDSDMEVSSSDKIRVMSTFLI